MLSLKLTVWSPPCSSPRGVERLTVLVRGGGVALGGAAASNDWQHGEGGHGKALSKK